MSVVQYLDNLSTLFNFHQVSHHCAEAIERLRINPSYQISDIEAMLGGFRLKNALKELRIFEGIDTLNIDVHSLMSITDVHLRLRSHAAFTDI